MEFYRLMAHVQLLEILTSFARYPGREGEVGDAWRRLLERRLGVTAVKRAFAKLLRRRSGVAALRAGGQVEFLLREARRLNPGRLRNKVST